MYVQPRIPYQSAPLCAKAPLPRTPRYEDPNPFNYPDEEDDVPMPPDDPARKAPIDEPPSPSKPQRV